jgi:transposase InsO family protein
MLADGIIELANGPYAAPVTLQPKKDGSLRFCVDFRQLNSVTVRDVYPLPRIDDTLDQLQTAQYFTSLDLKSGFWQIELDAQSRPKTAFVTHAGLFQFKVMPFGLTNAPATFQRLMDLVLGGLKWTCALVYLDDIIVYSPSFELHLEHLESVLKQLQASGLTLQISKCQFCKTKLKYLGHVVSSTGIEPDPDKVRAVQAYPVPTRLKEVRSFLGLTSYYRRFIKNYATIAEPLISLTRDTDHKQFTWTLACQQAFEHLRQLLAQAPIISYPHFDHPFLLQLDASDVGLSAILAQKLIDSDGVQREHVIGYASRTLSSAERHYSPTERECLAIVYGCSHFRPYLEGVRFTILTDHKALKWLHRTKDLNSRLARWAMQIAAYDVDIQHRPGADNANCDALSRAPVDAPSISTLTSTSPDLISVSTLDAPGQRFLLDHFRRSSLPPPHFIIPLSLIPVDATSGPLVRSTSFITEPSSSTSSTIQLANLHFGVNVPLYEELRHAQWQDDELLPLMTYLQHSQQPDSTVSSKVLALATTHRLIDGALFRVIRSSPTHIDQSSTAPTDLSSLPMLPTNQQLRFVVPKSKVRDLLSLAHDHPTAAHLGRRKTLFRLASRFTWSHMRRDVIAYVRACPLCQQYKPSTLPSGGLMKPILVHEPWNTVGIDLTGPLPKTRQGNLYILVVIDYFTKWVELFPLPNTKAKTIAQLFLDEVICRFGFPVRLISDNGVQFVSSIFTNVCQSLGIQHQRTPLYHPQANLCERVNRTLKPLLAALAHHDHKSWDLKLPQIAFALRTAPSDSTEQSPAFLMFGRHPRQPLDLALPPSPTSDLPPTTGDRTAYHQRRLAGLLPAYQSTRELLDIAHHRQARHYDSHHRPLEFEPDDLVWVTALSGIAMGKWRGKKFAPRREGPYRVVRRLSTLTYSLQHTLTNRTLTPIHVNRLEPYHSFSSVDS